MKSLWLVLISVVLIGCSQKESVKVPKPHIEKATTIADKRAADKMLGTL